MSWWYIVERFISCILIITDILWCFICFILTTYLCYHKCDNEAFVQYMEKAIGKRKFSKYGFVWHVFVVCIFHFSFALNAFIPHENDVQRKRKDYFSRIIRSSCNRCNNIIIHILVLTE